MNRRTNNVIGFGGTGLLVLFIVLVIWFNVTAPCGCFANYPNKNIPARCLENFKTEGK